MTQASIRKTIATPAEKLRETLRRFNGVDNFLPAEISCRVEGTGVGAKRFCSLQDGAELSEDLLSLDNINRQLAHSVNADEVEQIWCAGGSGTGCDNYDRRFVGYGIG